MSGKGLCGDEWSKPNVSVMGFAVRVGHGKFAL
jgi:hypothetical protein